MSMSRRSFLKSSAAAATLTALGTTPSKDATAATKASRVAAVSNPGDVVGKVTVGYQGWFAAPGDGAPVNRWWHWAGDESRAPSVANNALRGWPDMREYVKTYPTGYAALGNGTAATLFSSFDQETVDVHFSWMRQYGIDTAALQRFNPFSGEGPTRDYMAQKVRTAAERYGRKFYIMYDVSGWADMQTQLKTDWTSKMSAHTASSAYAKQNGKPVVCIWGFGFNDDSHPFSQAACMDVISWFKSQGCYVIGGVPTNWRTGVSDSRPGYIAVYHSFNMISPWMIGRMGSTQQSDDNSVGLNAADKADCDAHGIDYQPCIMPGDISVAGQRAHGNFMWRQFYNLSNLGVAGFYISMFDEYNEGHQIAKTAPTRALLPSDSPIFLGLDEDGVPCDSDFYLRLTGDGGRMLKGQIPLTPVRPTAPSVGSKTGLATVITLRSRTNNMYVTAESAGTQSLIANRSAIGPWEQFDMVDAGNGDVALLSHANGKYVTAENGGTAPLIANRTAIGPWESFRIIAQAGTNGGVAILSRSDGKYVSASGAGQGALYASGPQVGAWEMFDLLIS